MTTKILKKSFEFIKTVFELPIYIPIKLIYLNVIIYLIVQNNDIEDLDQINTEEELLVILDPHNKFFEYYFRPPLYVVSFIAWSWFIVVHL